MLFNTDLGGIASVDNGVYAAALMFNGTGYQLIQPDQDAAVIFSYHVSMRLNRELLAM